MDSQEPIRRTIARYVHGIDTYDVEAIVSLFAREGKLYARNAATTGHDEIRAFLTELFGGALPGRQTKHILGSTVITMKDETTAECLSDLVLFQCMPDLPWAVRATNRHHDRLVLEDGEWKFAEKKVLETQAFAMRSYSTER